MAHLAHYRQAHPLPFVITHWVNLICMLVLILTGFMIHFPFLSGAMGAARGAHIFCAFVILINLIVRLVFAFTLKDAQFGGTREGLDYDYKNFLPAKANKHQFSSWMKYYLFMKKDHPISTKYGSPQKLTYFLVPIVLICSILTGLCLWEPTSTWGLFSGITGLVGGIMNVRIIHYFLMWLFIIFIMIHVYLANIEGFAPTKLMLFRMELGGKVADPKTGKVIGEDDLNMKPKKDDESTPEVPTAKAGEAEGLN